MKRVVVERVASIALRVKAKFFLHFLDAGIMTFPAGCIHIRIIGKRNGAFSIRLAVAYKALHQHNAMLALIPVLCDFWRGLDMALKTVGNRIREFKVLDRFASDLGKSGLVIDKTRDPNKD